MTAGPHHLHLGEHSVGQIADRRESSIVAVVPTRDEAPTIGAIVRELVALRRAGVLDRVLVADDSADATPSIAERAGAEVVRQRELDSGLGPVRGKGDGMWRALGACTEDIVLFVDGDSADFGERHVTGLLGAVALDGHAFAKGTYLRPFVDVQGPRPSGGGRVTELTAKPMLCALFPELTAFAQPLAGEIAARTDLLRRLPLATGYAVDVVLLIDVFRELGLGAMAEADLGTRQNRHRPLHELGAMATEVAAAILQRAGIEGGPAFLERPPRAVAVPGGAPPPRAEQ